MRRDRRKLLLPVGLLFLAANAEDVSKFEFSDQFVGRIAESWQHTANEISGDLMASYDERLSQTLSEDEQAETRKELAKIFYQPIAWRAFSEQVLDAYSRYCRDELLGTVQDAIEQESMGVALDSDHAKQFSACSWEALHHLKAEAAYTLIAEANRHQVFLALLDARTSDYQRIAKTVSTAAVERVFGDFMDSIEALLDIEVGQERNAAIDSLKAFARQNPVILQATITGHGGSNAPSRGAFVYFINNEPPKGTGCSGSPPKGQQGLMRCSWNKRAYGDVTKRLDSVIRYQRPFSWQGEDLLIETAFDYPMLIEALRE